VWILKLIATTLDCVKLITDLGGYASPEKTDLRSDRYTPWAVIIPGRTVAYW